MIVTKFVLVLLIITSSNAGWSGGGELPRPNLLPCQYSDQVYNGDASLMDRREAPTYFRLMPSRYVSMLQAARGYQCTGTTAVSFDGHRYAQTARSDDPGLMEMIPTVSRLIGMSIASTYDLVIFVVILSGILIGYAALWHMYPTWRMRGISAAVLLCLAMAEARIADEYLFQISPLIAGIPWLLYPNLLRKKLALALGAALLAFCCSWCSLVRSGTLVICMTFLLTMFILRHRLQRPLLPILLVVLACVPSVLVERSLLAGRDAALARVGETATAVNSHAVWHTLYIGLGFIPNSEVPEYRDGVAGERVRAIDPTAAYTSPEYEAILRRELWSIIERRPWLVIGILAAKAGVLVILALILLYPARRLIFAECSDRWLDASFLATIAMSSMNGIVAVPRASYLLTFLCLMVLYTCIKRLSYHARQRPVTSSP